jgi:serine/threonine protein phosphatase 1
LWAAEPDAPSAEPLVYAVGDIHGMDDLLAEMLAVIESDAAARRRLAVVVFLGDVVNRGPHTRQVLDRLAAGPSRPGQHWIVLRGNHEQAMLDAVTMGDEASFRRWMKMGGMESLASYGGTRKHATPDRARDLIDPVHVGFLATLPLTHVVGDHLFVHAGVEPGVPLHQQRPRKLMTIRGAFLKKAHRLPYMVVHGHTPTIGDPLLGPGRIGVDTGACTTGILTAVAIGPHAGERRFLRVGGRVKR